MREENYHLSVFGIVAGLYAVFSLMGAAQAAEVSSPTTARSIGVRFARCVPGVPCRAPGQLPGQPPRSQPFPHPPTPVILPPSVPPVTRGGSIPSSTALRCPPMTVYSARLRRCVADPYGRRRLQEIPPVPTGNERDDLDERSAANIVNAALRGLDCGQASDVLRRLSNEVLALQASGPRTPPRGGVDPGEEVRRKWREHVSSPKFWKKVWNRMADAYRSCNRDCFDDGISVGELSATAYCSASMALGGLGGPGYIEQTPLPVCETSVFAGCLKAYGDTGATMAGCQPYTKDSFEGIFAEYESQDCHL